MHRKFVRRGERHISSLICTPTSKTEQKGNETQNLNLQEMETWLLITVVVPASFAGIAVLVIFWRYFYSSSSAPTNQNLDSADASGERAKSLQSGISKLQHVHHHHQIDVENIKKPNYSVFRGDFSSPKPLFSWSDHPSLITDAVEHGWSRFAFAIPHASPPLIRSATASLLGSCAGGQEERGTGVEISWEVSQGSADFVQKIRPNSGLSQPELSLIKAGLPLPGPPLGNSSFPQEAYFEITILRSEEDDRDCFGDRKKIKSESERAKLIQQNSSGKGDSDSLVHVLGSIHGNRKIDDLKSRSGTEEGRFGGIWLSLGLVRPGSLPLKLPGSFLGSVGFNSDGSVYLDGAQLVLGSQKQGWGNSDRVIGCGYNPTQKKVLFTLDSQLVHVISCRSEEFGTPLYPVLAATKDVTILVNFGQCAFKYSPANPQRTPNPCFIGPLAHSPALGCYEDSRELFSMGRIDSQWLSRCSRTSASGCGGNPKRTDFDEESEGDLFEIALEGSNVKSPNTVLQ